MSTRIEQERELLAQIKKDYTEYEIKLKESQAARVVFENAKDQLEINEKKFADSLKHIFNVAFESMRKINSLHINDFRLSYYAMKNVVYIHVENGTSDGKLLKRGDIESSEVGSKYLDMAKQFFDSKLKEIDSTLVVGEIIFSKFYPDDY